MNLTKTKLPDLKKDSDLAKVIIIVIGIIFLIVITLTWSHGS